MNVLQNLFAEFRALFPNFDAVSDDTVLLYLKIAMDIFSACTDATLWLAAFLLNEYQQSLLNEKEQDIPGTVIMAEVDKKRVQYKPFTTRNPEDAEYLKNNYGRMYLRLKQACRKLKLVGGVAGGC